MPEQEPIRDDLAELARRRALTQDAARPDAVARRHAAGGRTARENVADLVDDGSFVEYGRFAIAPQRMRREVEDLIARTPADGLVAGTARIDGHPCAVLSYDYTVLAGTQGGLGHRKKDRLFELIERMRLPTVFFAEGGEVAPATPTTRRCRHWTPGHSRCGPNCPGWCRASRWSGRCFAGNGDRRRVRSDRRDPGCVAGHGGPAMIAGAGSAMSRPTPSARWRCRSPTATSTCWSTTKPRRSLSRNG